MFLGVDAIKGVLLLDEMSDMMREAFANLKAQILAGLLS